MAKRGEPIFDSLEFQWLNPMIIKNKSNRHTIVIIVLFLSIVGLSGSAFAEAENQKAAAVGKSVVAADHVLASTIGVNILKKGGNAIDAGVATLLALGVLNPFASGIGGGGFCVMKNENDDVKVLDFRERAPLAATADMYLVDGKADIGLSIYGGLAVAIPGEVAGLFELHKKYGKLKWAEVVKPARKLALEGFLVGELLPKRLKSKEKKLEGLALAKHFKKGKRWLKSGDRFKRTALGNLLKSIEEKGPSAFYSGPVAAAISKEVKKQGGIITEKDLSTYTTTWREPLEGTYRGFKIYTMPPPSSGGTTILEALNLMEGMDYRTLGDNPETMHRTVEALKHAFADRARWLGDTDFVKVPTKTLIDKSYAKTKKMSPWKVLEKEMYGQSAPFPDDQGTSHISVADENSALACTSTINTSFGSLVYVEKYGIILNNEMGDFTAQPGVANNYGLMGTKQNAIEPGKRPLSSMSPTLVTAPCSVKNLGEKIPRSKEDCTHTMAVVGGSGGPWIITGTLLTLHRSIDFGWSPIKAVFAPRFHHQWIPELLTIEGEFGEDWEKRLTKKGHALRKRSTFFNAVQFIARDGENWAGVSDKRKYGRAMATD